MTLLQKNTGQLVADLLDKYPELRDDDKRLIANVWRIEYGFKRIDEPATMRSFLNCFIEDFSSPESIRRTRQKLQEEFIQFRGEKYDERHSKLEPEVREEIKSFNS